MPLRFAIVLGLFGLARLASAEPLGLSAEVAIEAPGQHERRVPLALSRGECAAPDACWKAIYRDGDIALSFTLGPGARALPWSAELESLRAQPIRRVTLHLSTAADDFTLLGRDYRVAHPGKALLDRFDPKWVTLIEKKKALGALLADDDFDTLGVSKEHGRVVFDVELFDVLARPFGHLPRCGHVWRDVKGRVTVADRFLHEGDRFVASGELMLGAVVPVALSPWPDGREAAFVVTDHADQTSAETLHALLAGSADADLDHPRAGLLGHHVPITKALFLHGTAHHEAGDLAVDEAEVKKLAERMRHDGSEVAPHSATPLTDSRDVVDDALAQFSKQGASVWIDHQPQTNCEGFSQAGWKTGTGISDLLEKHRFTDVWDLTEWAGHGLDERDPEHLDKRAPTIWPLGRLEADGPASLWMFRSTWAFLPQRAFYERYGEHALDRLEHDRGLHVAHTYLETLHAPGTFYGRRNLERRDTAGRATLDPRFDAVLASLDARSQRGSLWLTPLGPLAARLRALQSVQLRVDDEGNLHVTRPGTLDGVTLHFATEPPLDTVAGAKSTEGAIRAWLAPCADPCTTKAAHDLLR